MDRAVTDGWMDGWMYVWIIGEGHSHGTEAEQSSPLLLLCTHVCLPCQIPSQSLLYFDKRPPPLLSSARDTSLLTACPSSFS